MWTISQVKTNARAAFKRSYWKCVVVALIATLLLGGSGGLTFNLGSLTSSTNEIIEDFKQELPMDEFFNGDADAFLEEIPAITEDHLGAAAPLLIAGGIIAAVAALIGAVIGSAVRIFLLNPLELGINNFFWRNRGDPETSISAIGAGFSKRYLNVVLALFLRGLYIWLWSLLLVIPGIIKSYSYRMVPYLLAEAPHLDQKRAFQLSMAMMHGFKWKAFVLELSFIGWHILNAFTCGILGLFYVEPYQHAARAEFYVAVRTSAMQSGVLTEEELHPTIL